VSRRSEQQIADAVCAYLAANGWEIFEEVTVPSGARADIVAIMRHTGQWAGKDHEWSVRMIVETKTAWSTALLEQMIRHAERPAANLHFACAPGHPPYALIRRVGGFGALTYSDEHGLVSVCESIASPFRRPARRVNPPASTRRGSGLGAPAGSTTGGHWTPYRATCRAVLAVATRQPGITLRDMVAAATHHYASDATARSTLAIRIANGHVPGVELRREAGKLRVYKVEVEK
jgi:hypothetical protein